MDYFGLCTTLRFRYVKLCLNLMTLQAKRKYHAWTQGIRKIKTFAAKKVVSNDKITEKQSEQLVKQILARNLASATHILPTFEIFCCKIEIAEKIKWLLCFCVRL